MTAELPRLPPEAALELLNLPRLRISDRKADDGFKEPKPLRRQARKRSRLHAIHVDSAAKMLSRLPESGESIHCVIRGTFHAWDFVPAVLKLAAPASITRLDVATLSFANENAIELVELMDAGRVGYVSFICSGYYSRMNKTIFEDVVNQITGRGGKVSALPSHAKVTLMELSDGRHISIEGSANLRSCRNIEQCVVTEDRELLLFHRAWMEELHAAGWTEVRGRKRARKKTNTNSAENPPGQPGQTETADR